MLGFDLHGVRDVAHHIGAGALPSLGAIRVVLHVPVEAWFACAWLVGHVLAELQRLACVGVHRREDRRLDRIGEGIVGSVTLQRIHHRAFVARVQPTGCDAGRILQVLRKLGAGETQVCLEPRGCGNSGVALELCGDGSLLRSALEVRARQQRRCVVRQRILLDLMNPGFERGWLIRRPCGGTTRWRRSSAARGRSRSRSPGWSRNRRPSCRSSESG